MQKTGAVGQLSIDKSIPARAAHLGFWHCLTDDTIFQDGGISIGSDGRIKDVGCITPSQAIIYCPGQVVSPGLINPHDHLTYNQNFPGGQNNDSTVPNTEYLMCNKAESAYSDPVCSNYQYDRRNEWRKGLYGKPKINAPSDWASEANAWNELRHVLPGATTIAGSSGQIGLARNPDKLELMERLETQNKYV